MPPSETLVVAAILYLLLRLWLRVSVPLWEKRSLSAKIGYAPLIASLEKLRDLALTGAIVSLAILLLVGLTRLLGGSSETTVGATLGLLRAFRAFLKPVEAVFSGVGFLLAFIVVAVIQYRVLRRQVVLNIQDAVRQRAAALRGTAFNGGDAPTVEMRDLLARLQQAYSRMRSLNGDDPGYFAGYLLLRGEIDDLERRLAVLDFDRQVQLAWESDAALPRGRWTRLWRTLTSKSAFTSMKGARKYLSYATTGLLMASLAGFQTPVLGEAVASRIAELDGARVQFALDSAKANLKRARQEAATQPSPASNPTPAQEQALRNLARLHARSFARAWRTADSWKDAEKLRVELTRWALRREWSQQNRGTQSEAGAGQGATASNASWNEEERATADDYARAGTGDAGASPLEEDFVKEAAAEGVHNSPWFAAVEKETGDSERVEAASVEEFLVNEAANGIAASFSDFIPSEVGKLAAKAVNQGFAKLFVQVYQLSRTTFFATWLRTGDTQRAVDDSQRAARRVLSSDLLAEFDHSLPHVGAEFAEKLGASEFYTEDHSKWPASAEAALRDLPSEARKGYETNLANLASDYETEFPQNGKGRFARDTLLKVWDVTNTNSAEERAARATDFGRLESYSRVGGILFGRQPPPKPVADITSFTWPDPKQQGGYYRLRLAGPSQPVVELGPFPAYLINQALAYAADGRATILTMMNGEAIGRKQVIIHPAFENTPLGCRLMAADEWIFDYTDSETAPDASYVRRTLNEAGLAVELYKGAVRTIHDSSSAAASPALPAGLAKDLSAGIALLKASAENLGLSAGLLDAMNGCANGRAPSWSQCLSDKTKSFKTSIPEQSPTTGFVSQIREREYRTDSGLTDFLTPPNTADALWPLDMTVQLTVNDAARWEVPRFAPEGPTAVLQGLRGHGQMKQLQEVRELCLLQRLFRAALTGTLGARFPMESLIRLQAETGKTVARSPTPRWLANGRDSRPALDLEFSRDLDRYKIDAEEGKFEQTEGTRTAFSKVKACESGIQSGEKNSTVEQACSFDFEDDMKKDCASRWDGDSTAQFDKVASCRIAELAYLTGIVRSVYQVRDALGAGAVRQKASTLACAQAEPAVMLGQFAQAAR